MNVPLEIVPKTSSRCEDFFVRNWPLRLQGLSQDFAKISAPLSLKSSLGRYVFGSEISYNKAPPRLPGLGC
jgi:hypothetical protein